MNTITLNPHISDTRGLPDKAVKGPAILEGQKKQVQVKLFISGHGRYKIQSESIGFIDMACHWNHMTASVLGI